MKQLELPEEALNQPHDARSTELEYRLEWARSHLKLYGLLESAPRSKVWVFSPQGQAVETVDAKAVRRFLLQRRRDRASTKGETTASQQELETTTEDIATEATWREELSNTLLHLTPAAFERLCQRLLRESGFVEVRVTGRSGDGGIDGVGLVQIGGLLSFPVLFQCKRYKDSVGPSEIRDFRGAMTGRADRGLVITTGRFTRDARGEATRDGAPPIDLVDGDALLDKLKELRLGVRLIMVEDVSVDREWFSRI